MNRNVIPKTGKRRIRTRLIGLFSCVILAGHFLGCFQLPTGIPKELHGKYRTTHPEYEDQFFKLGTGLITLGFAGGKLKFYNVKKVEKEIIDHRKLYTILCANEAEGERFNFAFFADYTAEGEGVIHFRNKARVTWKKQEQGIDYVDYPGP